MLKLTKTGIGLLTRQYRSVLHKCFLINIGLFALGAAAIMTPSEAKAEEQYITISEFWGYLGDIYGSYYLPHDQGEFDIGYTVADGLLDLEEAIHDVATSIPEIDVDDFITGSDLGSAAYQNYSTSVSNNTIYAYDLPTNAAVISYVTGYAPDKNLINDWSAGHYIKAAGYGGMYVHTLSQALSALDSAIYDVAQNATDTDTTYSAGTAISISGSSNSISVNYDNSTIGVSGDQLYVKGISANKVSGLSAVATSGNYSDLSGKPTNVSQFTNDAGYLTSHQDISGKADKATTLAGYGITNAYTKTEADNKFLTEHQSLNNYYTKLGKTESVRVANDDEEKDCHHCGKMPDQVGHDIKKQNTVILGLAAGKNRESEKPAKNLRSRRAVHHLVKESSVSPVILANARIWRKTLFLSRCPIRSGMTVPPFNRHPEQTHQCRCEGSSNALGVVRSTGTNGLSKDVFDSFAVAQNDKSCPIRSFLKS